MAILTMKKLRLAVVRSQKKELLRELLKSGCVQFAVLDDKLKGSEIEGIVKRESSSLMNYRTQCASIQHAVSILDKYAPAKSSLLSAKPEYETDELLDETGLNDYIRLAAGIEENEDRIRRIVAEQSRLRSVIESVTPWIPLELPLGFEGTERCAAVMGTLPLRVDPNEVNAAVSEVSEEAQVFEVNSDKSLRYIVLICMKDAVASMQEKLRTFGFVQSALGSLEGSARKVLGDSEASIKALDSEKAGCEDYIRMQATVRDEMKLAADKLSAKVSMAEAEERLYGSETFVMMGGWMPAEKEEEIGRLLSGFDCAWETEDPTEEEYPDVPVKLRNNKFTNSLNMVTNMYSLPAYGTVDPNPLMAPFFILFFGLMMADMGYGILMIAAALVAKAKLKPREGSLAFVQLLLYGGISTFLMGALTGAFFSDIPYQIVHVINPESTWPGLWHLFSPETDSTMVLYGSMVLGLIHLVTGMVVSFVQKKKAGNLAGAIFEEGSLWVVLLGGGLYALESMVLKINAVSGLAVLCIGLVMLLFGAGREAKGFGKVTAAFGCIYNTATGWFGDILSYARIMALMLAGGVVGKVFNTVAVMPSQGGITVVSVIAFVVIFVLGHAMNFGLNLLGCYVHDLRLQCLEFFGKFYVDGGKAFAPLRFSGKYVNAKE